MKKLFITITLLFALVGSAFAWDYIKYGSFENEKAGAYIVYMDIEAREPYSIEKEDIIFLLYLQKQKEYSYVSVSYYNPNGEGLWCKVISEEHKIYGTMEIYENYDIVYHVCDDGCIVEYVCYKNK